MDSLSRSQEFYRDHIPAILKNIGGFVSRSGSHAYEVFEITGSWDRVAARWMSEYLVLGD